MPTAASGLRLGGPRTTLALIAVVLVGACGGGHESGLAVSPDVLDWGRVVHGDRVIRELTLSNTSDRAIYVNEVKANCACVQPGPFQRNLQPGETRTVQVALETRTLPIGELKGKKLDILSTDLRQPFAEAKVRASIYRTHTMAPPQRLDVGRLAGDRRDRSWRVHIQPLGEARVEVVRAVVSPPGVFVVTPEEMDNGYDLVIEVADDAGGEGAFQTQLAVELEVEEDGRPKRRIVERLRVDGSW